MNLFIYCDGYWWWWSGDCYVLVDWVVYFWIDCIVCVVEGFVCEGFFFGSVEMGDVEFDELVVVGNFVVIDVWDLCEDGGGVG